MTRLDRRIVKALASLKLAVVIILALGTLTAVGTFVEARYDAVTAQKLVYHSSYMTLTLAMLAVTLIAVMIDRWPWKSHHAGFVLAHIGIIVLLIGSWVTQKYGLDGTLQLSIGGKNRFVSLGDTNVGVYATLDGDQYASVASAPVDFLSNPPTPEKPFVLTTPNGDIRILEFYPYAHETRRFALSKEAQNGPAVRFQISNDRVNVTEWLHASSRKGPAVQNLGPAQVVLTREAYTPSGQNEVVLLSKPQGLEYVIYSKERQVLKRGKIEAGGQVQTGWMGLVFRVLDYLPQAVNEIKYTALEQPTAISTSAVQFEFMGRKEWVGRNGMVKIFGDQIGYIITYQNRLHTLNFELELKNFEVGRYQGTMRAASYASRVLVPGRGEVTISMNEPLKYEGFTFYQASFEEDEQGRPTSSILSVNYDPGRFVKYAGALFIVLGSIVMFYFKRRKVQQRPQQVVKEAV